MEQGKEGEGKEREKKVDNTVKEEEEDKAERDSPDKKNKEGETSPRTENSDGDDDPGTHQHKRRTNEERCSSASNPQQPQQPPAQQQRTCSLASFDRLKPRLSGMKRKNEGDEAGGETGDDALDGGSKRISFRKEYGKLRSLVPALTEREDLSKVEIIEETIRYIDALHHQLAAKMETTSASSESGGTSTRDQQGTLPNAGTSDTAPAASQCLRQVASTSTTGSGSDPSASSTPSSSMNSTQDLKAAVENIQAMFQAYLQEDQGNYY